MKLTSLVVLSCLCLCVYRNHKLSNYRLVNVMQKTIVRDLCTIVLLSSSGVKSGLNRSFISIARPISFTVSLLANKILACAKVSHIFTLLFVSLLMMQPALADYVNSIGMAFKDIPAGSFYMGSCQLSDVDDETQKQRKFLGLPKDIACPEGGIHDSTADSDEMPRHRVRISKGFQIGTYEVTIGQFKQFIVAQRRDDLLTDSFISYNRRISDDVAVVVVSWYDAQAFIRWLNKKEGRHIYRLPTEAEWEYAARAGTDGIYAWPHGADAGDYAWFAENAGVVGKYAQVVGDKQSNRWGLYDMHGNVWEWVQDWHSRKYYRNRSVKDPLNNRTSRARVFRGGSWKNEIEFLRAGDRGYGRPGLRGINLGFRLVRQL